MNLLGIEGALGAFSAAIVVDGTVRASAAADGNVALEQGLALVSQAMREAQIDAKRLDRLAVGIGPGGFTGLRITIAYAKSLAQAWKLPLVAVSSFDILEYGYSAEPALAVVTGRPGVISVRYRDGDLVRRASGPIAEALREVLPATFGGTLPVFGAPEDVLALLAEGGFIVETRGPTTAPAAAAVALAGATSRPAASAHEVRADYGEAPAAKVPHFGAERRS